MTAQKLTRRQREKQRQRQEVLEAALGLFSDKGYHNVSMHQIADKAEFAIGTLYKFFRNKETLYRALILEYSRIVGDELVQAIEVGDDEIEKLRSYVRTKGRLFRTHFSVVRLYFSETHGASFNMMAGLDSKIRAQHRDFLQTLASVFVAGIKKNRFRKIADPFFLAVALDGLTNAFLFPWLEDPERCPYPEDPDGILNIFFKGLLAKEDN